MVNRITHIDISGGDEEASESDSSKPLPLHRAALHSFTITMFPKFISLLFVAQLQDGTYRITNVKSQNDVRVNRKFFVSGTGGYMSVSLGYHFVDVPHMFALVGGEIRRRWWAYH